MEMAPQAKQKMKCTGCQHFGAWEKEIWVDWGWAINYNLSSGLRVVRSVSSENHFSQRKGVCYHPFGSIWHAHKDTVFLALFFTWSVEHIHTSHTLTFTHTHVHILHTLTHVDILHMLTHIHTFTKHTITHIYSHTIHTHKHALMHTYTLMSICTHAHTHIHTHAHTHTHTHTQVSPSTN